MSETTEEGLLKCEKCSEAGVGYNDDGQFLCEDCLFEDSCAKAFPPEHDIFPEDFEP